MIDWGNITSERWGDSDVITFISPAAVPPPVSVVSKQLVAAKVPSPIAWSLLFDANGVQIPAAQITDLVVDFEVAIGVGQARTTIHFVIVLPVATGFVVAPRTIANDGAVAPGMQIPAEEINVTARVTGQTVGGAHYVVAVSAMAAPFGRWN
jgi:hypothetical protein